DPTAASILDRDCGTREGETVAMNYKPSPLQVKLGTKNKNILQKFTNMSGNGAILDLALVSHEDAIEDLIIRNSFGFKDNKFNPCKLNEKKGPKKDPDNYTPFSLTSVPGKIMEQIILSAIMQHVQDNQVIKPSQHGFRKVKSCLTNSISFYAG
ncbi:hypothetical protein HGM15179_020050, partial [Zosterops borbonicus]